MILHWISAYLLSVALVVSSQSSNVTCDVSFAWTENTKEQNPCLVSSYLQSLCGRAISVNQIPVGTHYLGPQTAQQATTCSCSSVVYSLTSACGMCQGRTIVNWTSWATNCPEPFQSMGSFPLPIPDGTQVPEWAYLNITAGGGWDQFRAKAAADNATTASPSSTQPRPSQETIRTSSDQAPTSGASQSASTRSQTPSGGASGETAGSSSNAGAIAGGVVGGLVGLVGIGLLALWLLLRKKRKEKLAPPKDFVIDEPASTTAMVFHNTTSNSTTMSPPPQSQRTPTPYSSNIYVASSEERRPPPMRHASSMSDMYTTLTTRRSQESFNVSQFGTHVPPSTAGYRGAPEV